MLQFTRIQATIILVAVLVICVFSVPNFVSDETIGRWPEWAQRRMTLAPELQGGTSVLFEIDRNRVREDVLEKLFREVRDVLRDARIGVANPLAIRSGSVEVRPLDYNATLAKLGELSRAFNGVRAVEVTDAGGGLIRVTPTEAGLLEYEPPISNHAIANIRARLLDIPATIEREGAWRIRVQVPRHGPEVFTRVVW